MWSNTVSPSFDVLLNLDSKEPTGFQSNGDRSRTGEAVTKNISRETELMSKNSQFILR